jgi:hypothetical protein
MAQIKPNESWVLRENDYLWTDCFIYGTRCAIGKDLATECGNRKSDSPTTVFHSGDSGDQDYENNTFIKQYRKHCEDDRRLDHFCQLEHVLNEFGAANVQELITKAQHHVRRTTSADLGDLGCPDLSKCDFEVSIACPVVQVSTHDDQADDSGATDKTESNVIAPPNELWNKGDIPRAGYTQAVSDGDGCSYIPFAPGHNARQVGERIITVTKTSYDEAFKQSCCTGGIPNSDARCDPAWRPDDPEGACLPVFEDLCSKRQEEPCGRHIVFNDQPTDNLDGSDVRAYCKAYMDDIRALYAPGLTPTQAQQAKLDALQTMMREYCQGPGFGYGECACINAALPCRNPFQPVPEGGTPSSQQECVTFHSAGHGGAARRFQATDSRFTESKDGDPLPNAGGMDITLVPMHCWAPACNRSGRCMFRDYLGDAEPCPSICGQYIDNEHISVKSITGKAVYIGNHVTSCSLGNAQLADAFIVQPANVQRDISDVTEAFEVTLQVSFVDFLHASSSSSSSSTTPEDLYASSIAALYREGHKAPALQDVSPTSGTFQALSTLEGVISIAPADAQQALSVASPTTTVTLTVTPAAIAKPAIDTHFAVDVIIRDATGVNPDVLVPIDLHYQI